jgi:cupin 2 domain-containing protein
MTPVIQNLLADVPAQLPEEQFIELTAMGGTRVERIVSHGHASPPGFWYEQAQAEWVLVLAGAAGLQFEGEDTSRTMRPGDHVLIPAGVRHRVAWTDAETPTIWLAVHFAAA